MAESKCIASLIDVEASANVLGAFCAMVHDLAPDTSPEWLAVLYSLVRELERTMQAHAAHVRGQAC